MVDADPSNVAGARTSGSEQADIMPSSHEAAEAGTTPSEPRLAE